MASEITVAQGSTTNARNAVSGSTRGKSYGQMARQFYRIMETARGEVGSDFRELLSGRKKTRSKRKQTLINRVNAANEALNRYGRNIGRTNREANVIVPRSEYAR